MTKYFLFSLTLILTFFSTASLAQTGYVESFEDNTLTNWQQVNDNTFTLDETNQMLQVSGSSSGYHNLEHSFGAIDISGNPVVTFRVRTDTEFDLRVDLLDGNGNNVQNTETISNSDFQRYTIDFSGQFGGTDATNINRLVLFFNAGSAFSGNVDFDYFVIGDSINTVSGDIRVNQVGYELNGPKRAVFQSGNSSLSSGDFHLINASDDTVYTGQMQSHGAVGNWNQGNFWTMDFSDVTTAGTYRVTYGGNISHPFDIEENLLFDRTAHSVVNFFDSMRCEKPGDASLSFNGARSETVNVFGGWWDANGDPGKHFSHLSYANHFSPQQTPLVVWSLLKSYEMYPGGWSAHEADLKQEAAWGADYILRNIDPEGYIYLAIFDDWGGDPASREICEWGQEGNNAARTPNYQSAFREGAGISIAALARASRMNLTAGDSTPSQYLNGAETVYQHLTSPGDSLATKSMEYCNNGKPNIIDHYTALIAAVELFRATNDSTYLEDARDRVDSLLARVNSQGWWESDANGDRPYYHAAEEGMPALALTEFKDVDNTKDAAINSALQSVNEWYFQITDEVTNPFNYVRQYGKPWDIDNNQRLTARKSFFVPQDNETEYWWQGENARLASMSTGFLASRLSQNSDFGLGTDSLSDIVYSQLNWILGSNPYGRCMLYGFGEVNYPIYLGNAYQTDDNKNPNFPGGICNGITGTDGSADGSGIDFAPYDAGNYQNWRWVEQWLPHDAWYLLAITYLAKAVENEGLPVNLLNFEVENANGKAALRWMTNSEQGIDAYIIQRSANGKHFSTVGRVKARNAMGERGYRFTDHDVKEGTWNYRLKIQEEDGSSRTSDVKQVTFSGDAFEASVAPNPARDGFRVVPAGYGGMFDVRVTNLMGQEVFSRAGVTEQTTLGRDLDTGIYLVHISAGAHRETVRVVVE